MEGENKDQDRLDLSRLTVNEDDNHPDHQINRNVDEEDLLKNKKEDVTGESSSAARDDVNLLLGRIRGTNGLIVPVYYSETMIFNPRSLQESVLTQDRNSLSINPYIHLGLDTTEFGSDNNNKLTGVIVGPVVHRMVADFRFAPMFDGRIGDTHHVKGKFVSGQQGGSSSKDHEKAKK